MNKNTVLKIVIVVIIFSIAVIAYANTLTPQGRTIVLRTLSTIQFWLATGAFLWVLWKKKEMASILSSIPITSHYMRAVIGVVMLCFAVSVVVYLTNRGETTQINVSSLIQIVLYQLLMIAWVEELIFRGFLFASLRHSTSRAILVSSMMFSLYHLNNGLHTLPYYFALGIIFAILRYYGFSLYVLVFGHAIFNITLQTIWPIDTLRFGVVAFYIVAPLFFICIATLGGWVLSTIIRKHYFIVDK